MKSSSNIERKYIIFLVLVIAILGALSIYFALTLGQDTSPTDSNADVNNQAPFVEPTEAVLSNVTSNSVTVSWYTEEAATGYIKFGSTETTKNSVVRSAEDSATLQPRKLHYIRIRGLEPESTYFLDIYSNDQVYTTNPITTFKTFPQSEELSVPVTLLINAPTSFASGGVFYGHVKKGSEISTPISIKATSNKIAFTVSNARDKQTGESFDVDGAYVLVSGTNEAGERTREILPVTENVETLDSASATIAAYNPTEDFTIPAGGVAQTPVTPATPTTPTSGQTPVTQTPTTPTTQTPTTVVTSSGTVTQIPKTAIEVNDIITYAQLGFGGVCMILAISLLRKKKAENYI